MGGKPNSPTCNGSSLTGIGIQKATKIMYNAMLMKTSAASYLKYRTWSLTAARYLFPGSCTEFNAVKAAWTAVSVPAQTGDPTCTTGGNTVTVANPGNRTGTVGTATSLQMTATDSQAGQTLTWSATGLPAGLSINASVRPDLGYADHGVDVQRERDREGHHERPGLDQLHLDDQRVPGAARVASCC